MNTAETELPPDPGIEWYKKRVNREALRANLKLTVEERLNNLMRLQQLAEELRAAGREEEIEHLTTANLTTID